MNLVTIGANVENIQNSLRQPRFARGISVALSYRHLTVSPLHNVTYIAL